LLAPFLTALVFFGGCCLVACPLPDGAFFEGLCLVAGPLPDCAYFLEICVLSLAR
jgi:hypothetical protein